MARVAQQRTAVQRTEGGTGIGPPIPRSHAAADTACCVRVRCAHPGKPVHLAAAGMDADGRAQAGHCAGLHLSAGVVPERVLALANIPGCPLQGGIHSLHGKQRLPYGHDRDRGCVFLLADCVPIRAAAIQRQNVLFTFLIATMLLPTPVLLIPQFLLFYQIGWYGTYYPLWVPDWRATLSSSS